MRSFCRNNVVMVTGTAVVAALAVGAASGTDAIKERQQAMKDIGGAMQPLAAIVKQEAPFDASVVERKAKIIAGALERAAQLFPEGSDKGEVETWAQPEIWTARADFEEKLERARSAAVALQAVTNETAFPAALGRLGDACKACHQTYRRPKN